VGAWDAQSRHINRLDSPFGSQQNCCWNHIFMC
jgi:hypothetical protein